MLCLIADLMGKTDSDLHCPLAPRRSDAATVIVTGEVHLRVAFKYPEAWDPVYRGVAAFEGTNSNSRTQHSPPPILTHTYSHAHTRFHLLKSLMLYLCLY